MPGDVAQESPVSVRLSQAQQRELDRIARETGRSVSELIREAIAVLIGAYNNAQPVTTKE